MSRACRRKLRKVVQNGTHDLLQIARGRRKSWHDRLPCTAVIVQSGDWHALRLNDGTGESIAQSEYSVGLPQNLGSLTISVTAVFMPYAIQVSAGDGIDDSWEL